MSTLVAPRAPSALAAEGRRLRATRSTGWAVLATLAMAVLLAVANVLLAGRDGNPALRPDTLEHVLRAPGQVLGFAMLVVGVLAAAGEYRHGTVVTSLLAQPHRARWAAVKAVAVARLGAVAGVLAMAVSVAVAVPLLVSRHAPGADLGALPLAAVSVVLVGAGYGVIGVALGLLLRNQTAALTTALVWQFVVEGALPAILRTPGMVRYLPGGAADSLVRLGDPTASDLLVPWAGAALFTAYALALLGLAVVVAVPRDVT